jgi:hypothetical protein
MVDMASFASAVSSLKTAGDIAKALVGLHDAQTIQSKVIELNGIILSAQQSALAAQSDQFTLLERVRELEKEVARLEAWNAEKDRYELKDVGLGSLAYVVKEAMRGAEPPHQICAACFQHGKKSILQPRTISMERLLICSECKMQIKIGSVPWRRPTPTIA